MSDVPVVPGDDHVACQHCYDRIRPGRVERHIYVGKTTGEVCFPGRDHKPMLVIKVGR